MTEKGNNGEQKNFLCDLCSKEVSWSELVNVHIRDIQKTVREGFNPFEAPGVTMPDPETLFPEYPDIGPEMMYEVWCERTMIDSAVDHWSLCHDCAQAMNQPIPEAPAFRSKAPAKEVRETPAVQPQFLAKEAVKKDTEPKTREESRADFVAVVLFVLATSWVGSMIVFSIMAQDFLHLVTILGAICMGAGIMYFGFITFALPHQREDRDADARDTSAERSAEARTDYQAAPAASGVASRRTSRRGEAASGDYLHRLFGAPRSTDEDDDE